jgi:hypothetical protein
MKRLLVLSALSVTLFAMTPQTANAAAGPNLTASITPPPLTDVGATGRYVVTVANVGNQHAANSSVSIELPRTNTSPQVFVMGILGARSANCNVVGTNLNCQLGQIRRNRSTTVFFDIAFPQSSAPIVIRATAAVAGDTNPNNDTAAHTATVRYRNVPAGPGGVATNRHCTGTGLTAFYECTLFPGSISSHTAEFLGTGTMGTITVPGHGTITGTWALSGVNNSHLTFQYFDAGALAATFVGDGVDANCYEGLTTFSPPSAYVAPYEVCF